MAVDGYAFLTGRAATQDQFEPITWALCEMGRQTSAPAYLIAVTLLQRLSRDIARFLTEYDMWLTPTLAEPPVPKQLEELREVKEAEAAAEQAIKAALGL